MGMIARDWHDAFFSYARADNEAYSDFVDIFLTELKKKFRAEMRGRFDDLAADEADFFMDIKDLPASGSLTDELKEAVDKSKLLFIFVSRNYLRSKWCGQELAWFRNQFGGKRKEALEQTFVVVLEKDAKERCWGSFLELGERPLFKEFYDPQNGVPISPFFQARGKSVLDQNFDRQLTGIARSMADRAEALIKQARAEAPRRDLKPSGFQDLGQTRYRPEPEEKTKKPCVVIGEVTEDIGGASRALANSLREKKVEVRVLTMKDIVDEDAFARVETKTSDCQLFIQPYSDHKVLNPTIPGGHLRQQQELLNGRATTLWWQPQGEDGALLGPDSEKHVEQRPQHVDYLRRHQGCAEQMNVTEVTQRILQIVRPSPTNGSGRAPGHPKIWIESNPHHRKNLRQLRDRIMSRWSDKFADEAALVCEPLPWKYVRELEGEYIRKCHGIILIYGATPFDSLRTKKERIEEILETVHWVPGKAIALFPPRTGEGEIFWYSFDCDVKNGNGSGEREAGELVVDEDDVEELVDMIHQAFVSHPHAG